MAPMDDPKVAVLVIADNPKGVKYGSVTAAPGSTADTFGHPQIP